ncbi:hypothetical protein SAMN02745216_00583 [Desulfatibacillum alkenivorans DSM 16219]|jgi:hypothetical protein|uniref:DUF4177 domain-containing protein n=1 Tax=Desulfatibacillum alkenivorans DSM 16219 TaxID=1121393 RepID=A0A1M6E7S7_9BACT|nr:hypothetical protein [Desulfatibacillum alkenivorans]SHI81511.1 hypothetical protein SAMN02745216_00583 [Desulfatibacillum alkenivorans DSM 16219]
MENFEYDVTFYPQDAFSRVVAFCNESGGCTLDKVPETQWSALTAVLNEKGAQGWELVQVGFGKDGCMAIWKRRRQE